MQNLRFMLENENDFSFLSSPSSSYGLKVEKYYVLNRLTDPRTIDPLLALFEEYGVPSERVLTIPFDWDEYKKKGLRWDGGVAVREHLWGIGGVQEAEDLPIHADPVSDELSEEERREKQAKRETLVRLRALEYTLHDRNLYAINNVSGPSTAGF